MTITDKMVERAAKRAEQVYAETTVQCWEDAYIDWHKIQRAAPEAALSAKS